MYGGYNVPIIKGDKVISMKRGSKGGFGTLQHGSFGDADPKIVKMTGKSSYNVELKYDDVEGMVVVGLVFQQQE